jgi:HK97 family phage portal protein
MGALVKTAALGERALSAIGGIFRTSPTGYRWWWPTGNGDRGPPGAWQRNMSSSFSDPLGMTAFSAVYACTQIISADIAKLPINIIEIDPKTNERTILASDAFARLFKRPNSYQSRVDFIQLFILSYLIYGNAYILLIRDGRNAVTEMHVLDPRGVWPRIADDGSVFYQCSINALAGLHAGALIPARDIIHHRVPLSAANPLMGVTPIYAAASSSAMGIKILNNSEKFFGNMSRPSGTLTSDKRISEQTAERLKKDWDDNFSGDRIGRTAILGEGLKWEGMQVSAVDAQLIEQLRWSVEDVSRVFRVPPYLLGDMSKVTYRNTEQAGRAYIAGCLGYHLEGLEERFEVAFGFEPIYEIEFDVSAMLKTELDVRYAALNRAVGGPWMSPNEARSSEGFGPVDGGEEPMVQIQNRPLSQINEPPPASPNTPPAPGNDPNADDPASDKPAETDFDPAVVRSLIDKKLAALGASYDA